MAKVPTININTRVQQYVALRDKIKAMDKLYKEKTAAHRELLETLGGVLLGHLQTIGADSAASPSGTVYKTTKKSASITDGSVFWDYVVKNKAWDLLDKKANVQAVEDFIDSYSTPPPGVNFNSIDTVGVRRK